MPITACQEALAQTKTGDVLVDLVARASWIPHRMSRHWIVLARMGAALALAVGKSVRLARDQLSMCNCRRQAVDIQSAHAAGACGRLDARRLGGVPVLSGSAFANPGRAYSGMDWYASLEFSNARHYNADENWIAVYSGPKNTARVGAEVAKTRERRVAVTWTAVPGRMRTAWAWGLSPFLGATGCARDQIEVEWVSIREEPGLRFHGRCRSAPRMRYGLPAFTD